MDELLDEQVCPYCGHVVEDHLSNWDEEEEEVTCSKCDKEYKVKSVYQFEGFQMEKKCDKCGEWTEDGYKLCECGEGEQS